MTIKLKNPCMSGIGFGGLGCPNEADGSNGRYCAKCVNMAYNDPNWSPRMESVRRWVENREVPVKEITGMEKGVWVYKSSWVVKE